MQRKILGLCIALLAAAAAAQQQQPLPASSYGRGAAALSGGGEPPQQRAQPQARKRQPGPAVARGNAYDEAPGRIGGGSSHAASGTTLTRAGSADGTGDAIGTAAAAAAPAAAGSTIGGFHHEPAALNASVQRSRRVQDDRKLMRLFYQKLGGVSGGLGVIEDDRRSRGGRQQQQQPSSPQAFGGFSEYLELDEPLGGGGAERADLYGRGDAATATGSDDDTGGVVAATRGASSWQPAAGERKDARDDEASAAAAAEAAAPDMMPPAHEELAAQLAGGAAPAVDEASGACPNCQLMREEALAYRIEAIKQDIRAKLQLAQWPNVTRRQRDPRIPKHLLYRDALEEHESDYAAEAGDGAEADEDFATIERVFRFAEKVPDEKMALAAPDATYFDIPKQVRDSKIKRAKLGVYAYCADADCPARTVVNVRLYDAAPGAPREPISSQKMSVDRKGRWVHLDVTQLVESWSLNSQINYGVVAVADGATGSPTVRLSGAADDEDRKAFLDIQIGGATAGRRKRDLGLECTESSAEERCCRYPFTVDFDEFGPSFDFIITPRRYPANYCAGQCTALFLPMHTNTQLMQQSRRIPPNARQPCCTPRKLEGVFMVYVDDHGTYMQGVLPGMTIKSCGCS